MRENETAGDEISLTDILARLWAGRGILFVVTVLAAGLGALFVVNSALSVSRPITYYIALHNIENERYPNGTSFSPQNLLISDVLTQLRNRFNIPVGVAIRDAVTVNYASPVAPGITRAYRDRLAARNLTQPEIATINDSYLAQLNAATKSSLLIEVDYKALGVDESTGLAIAKALPDLWAKIYTTQFRIFSDTRLADYAVTRSSEDLATTASILVAERRLSTMRRGLNILMADNRLSMVRTADGISPADLVEDMRRFDTVFFTPIKMAGFKRDDMVTKAYLTEQRMNLADMQRRIVAYDETLKEVREHQLSSQQAPAASADNSALQVADSALREIVQLSQQASFATFVQDTLKKRNDLMFEISSVMKDIELATHGVEVNSQESATVPAVEMFEELTQHYGQLLTAARTQLLDRGGELYNPLLGPFIAGSLVNLRSVLTVGAAALAGGLLAIIIVLLQSMGPTMVGRRRTHADADQARPDRPA